MPVLDGLQTTALERSAHNMHVPKQVSRRLLLSHLVTLTLWVRRKLLCGDYSLFATDNFF